MSDPYDPIYAERVGRYLEDRRLACGYATLKSFGEAAGIDAKTVSWLIKGRPDNVSGTRFSARVLHSAETALKLPAGSIEEGLQTGDLAAFERRARRPDPAPLTVADADELAAISRKLYNILWRLPSGEVARVHLGAAISEVEKALHSYPPGDNAAESGADAPDDRSGRKP